MGMQGLSLMRFYLNFDDWLLIKIMEENYFKISQTMLTDILGILNDAPHKYVHAPILILQNLELIQEGVDECPNKMDQLIEG